MQPENDRFRQYKHLFDDKAYHLKFGLHLVPPINAKEVTKSNSKQLQFGF